MNNSILSITFMIKFKPTFDKFMLKVFVSRDEMMFCIGLETSFFKE